jgi:hypothetical protein
LVLAAPETFMAHMREAIVATHEIDPKAFWADAKPKQWREALEYAVELHEQRQHETSDGGTGPPNAAPPSDQSSGEGRADRRAGEAAHESATTPSPDSPTLPTESGHDG